MFLSFYSNALEKHIIIEVFIFTRNNLMFKSRKDNSSITIIFFCMKELNLMNTIDYGSYHYYENKRRVGNDLGRMNVIKHFLESSLTNSIFRLQCKEIMPAILHSMSD